MASTQEALENDLGQVKQRQEEKEKLTTQLETETDPAKRDQITKSIRNLDDSIKKIQKRIDKAEKELRSDASEFAQHQASVNTRNQLADQANQAINAAQGPFTYRAGTQSTSAMVCWSADGVQYELHWHSVSNANHTLRWNGNTVCLPFSSYAGRARDLLRKAGAPDGVLTWAAAS